MKKLIIKPIKTKKVIEEIESTETSIEDVEHDGMSDLLGKEVLLMGMNYTYTGTLVGVNHQFVILDSCRIVYETGDWSAKTWQNAQLVGNDHRVSRTALESWREVEKKK